MATLQRTRDSAWWNPSRWITGAIVAVLVMSWAKRLAVIGVAAVVLWGVMSLAGHGLKGWSPHPWGSGGLPVSAAEQAPLFARAWAAQDRVGMMRFVAPADEAKLKAWISANPVPASVADIAASDRNAKTISVEKDDTDGAIVKVRVSDETAASNDPKVGGGYTQRQAWAYSGGHWLFSPEAVPPDAVQQTVASNSANSRPNVAAALPSTRPHSLLIRAPRTSALGAGFEKRRDPEHRAALGELASVASAKWRALLGRASPNSFLTTESQRTPRIGKILLFSVFSVTLWLARSGPRFRARDLGGPCFS